MRYAHPIGCLILSVAVLNPVIADAKDVAVTPDQVKRMEIRVADVRSATTQAVAILPGTVVRPPNTRIAAAAPFAGTITQVHVLPGDRVKKGAPIATASSRELLETLSQLAQSEAELQTADAIARRKRILADKNFQSPTMAEEAEAQVAKIRAVIEQHKRTAALSGITIGQGGQYSIPAPADGRIVETLVVPGSKIDSMTAIAALDTSDELWVEVQVPAGLVPEIKAGNTVQIVGGPEGRVVSIAGSLDRMTRSALLLASLPAHSKLLPGQMVNVSILRPAETGALTVPETAVATINDGHGLFVRTEIGFTLVPVELRGKSPLGATVAGAIEPGTQVAASGLPQLEQMIAGE